MIQDFASWCSNTSDYFYQKHVRVIPTTAFSDNYYAINTELKLIPMWGTIQNLLLTPNRVVNRAQVNFPNLRQYAFRGFLLILSRILTSFAHKKERKVLCIIIRNSFQLYLWISIFSMVISLKFTDCKKKIWYSLNGILILNFSVVNNLHILTPRNKTIFPKLNNKFIFLTPTKVISYFFDNYLLRKNKKKHF